MAWKQGSNIIDHRENVLTFKLNEHDRPAGLYLWIRKHYVACGYQLIDSTVLNYNTPQILFK